MIGIYKITSPTGKVYIGQSWDIEERWKHYKRFDCREQRRLYNSLSKHGVDKHKFEIIHELPNDVEQIILDTYEQLYMDLYRDVGIELLNLRGAGSKGKHSEETKIKIGNANKIKNLGKKQTEEHIENKRLALIGSKRTEETKKKMSERQKGEKSYWFGKTMSDETKRKMSEARKGTKSSPETIAKRIETRKNNKINKTN